ncbi:hypothetical protein [Fluviispira vulneris]|uniref:hypothetical protein n=1 Tax=Fluviispira vulneris TaxID=2763012 RepID=UPI001646ED7C|nr:hypothetical protein [Fluviispira vulneris]
MKFEKTLAYGIIGKNSSEHSKNCGFQLLSIGWKLLCSLFSTLDSLGCAMYLASLYIVIDLDPEVVPSDRDRLLRSLREKLKQKFTHRITIRADEDETSLAIAMFDDNYERIKARLDEIHEKVDAAGEARIRFHQGQIFCWFNGRFVETNESLAYSEENLSEFNQRTNISKAFRAREKTIVYTDKDDDDMSSPVSSRFSRRNLRIPTRK